MTSSDSGPAHSTPEPNDTAPVWLGSAVGRRLRRPGPDLARPLPSRIGSLASSVQRFALATGRPVDIRRSLRGPDPAFGGAMRPPRWWTPPAAALDERSDLHAQPSWPVLARPVAAAPDVTSPRSPAERLVARRQVLAPGPPATASTGAWLAGATTTPQLGGHALPTAARSIPHQETWTPGGMLQGLRSEVVKVRRHTEVAAAGRISTAMVRRSVARAVGPLTATGASSASATPAAPTPAGAPSALPGAAASGGSVPGAAVPGAAGLTARPAVVPSARSRSGHTPATPDPGSAEEPHRAVASAVGPEGSRSRPRGSVARPSGSVAHRFVDALRRSALSHVPPALTTLRTVSTAPHPGLRSLDAATSPAEAIRPAVRAMQVAPVPGATLRSAAVGSDAVGSVSAPPGGATVRRTAASDTPPVITPAAPVTPRRGRWAETSIVRRQRSHPRSPEMNARPVTGLTAGSTSAATVTGSSAATVPGTSAATAPGTERTPLVRDGADRLPSAPPIDAVNSGPTALVLRRTAAHPGLPAVRDHAARPGLDWSSGDLLAAGRTARHALSGPGRLASGFQETVAIRPATRGLAPAPVGSANRAAQSPATAARPSVPPVAATVVRRSGASTPTPAQTSATRPAPGPVARTGMETRASRAQSSAATATTTATVSFAGRTSGPTAGPVTGPVVARDSSSGSRPSAGQLQGAGPSGPTPTSMPLRLVPAPPAGGVVRRSAAPAVAAPLPVPEVARAVSTPSLLDRTAHLFAAGGAPDVPSPGLVPPGLIRRLLAPQGGPAMTSSSPQPGGVTPLAPPTWSSDPFPPTTGAGLSGTPVRPGHGAAGVSAHETSPQVLMDELVDAVVARIERKVVDELERRGRRQGWQGL